MNFTREPIIETIISPKEGYKLLVRNSKGENFEEYYVDAIEVVSFGRAFFFRSMERPKAFLVPVSDYEILEVKEARVALKNVSHEKSIKIGGGREAHLRPAQREPKETQNPPEEELSQPTSEESVLETAVESRMERKRDRRRHRRRRGRDDREQEYKSHQEAQEKETEDEKTPEDETKGSSLFSTLIPPPPTLISETLSRYREKEVIEIKEEEPKKDQKENTEELPYEDKEEDQPGADSSPLHRVSTNAAQEESASFNATYFIPISGGNDPFFTV